jgi:transcriptional regulator with XRE-family HTH domain
MHMISAGNLSARFECLIESYDGGDRETAGRRLGIAADQLAGLLSGDWRRFSLEALARLVQGYGVSLDELFAFPRTEDSPWQSPRRFRPTSSGSTLPNSPGGS